MGSNDSDVITAPAKPEECEQLARLEFAAFSANEGDYIWPLMFPPVSEQMQEKRLQDRAHNLQKVLEAGKLIIMTAKLDSKIVGWSAWVPPGEDDFNVDKLGGFYEKFFQQMSNTRASLLDGTRYCNDRFLQTLVVDNTIWKRGVGRKLLQWGLNEAKQDPHGPADVYLESSHRAEAFYWRNGFDTLGWDSVSEEDAPDGVCKWPYMIKRAR